MSPSRRSFAELAKDTVAILRAGSYVTPAGGRVVLGKDLQRAVKGTIDYAPDDALPPSSPAGRTTRYEVVNRSTLEAARGLVREGRDVVALNFASARHPGGGFLGGARAQEESLCRSSGLYACLLTSKMYGHHAGERGGFYTNYAIYSPGVPVIRDDDGDLLDPYYLCSFITSPAVNAGASREKSRGVIRAEMARRVRKVLAIAAGHGHDAVVLGAWGCGVFRNDPEVVAELFRESLGGEFHGAFVRVVFAVLDTSDDEHFIGPFRSRFR
jgi:uncharacterized protein (TIGR02452 family)